ncbi:MAG: oxyanion-translocating ATPase [Actinomycetia bacterium]|nr:oxyanion-translocating ATPase [Actinomycetes bacterium]
MRIDELVDDRRVVICCGTGGVGKTTTAAVLALEGARRGRKACVVTIDPARRLADALGIERLTNDPTEIDPKLWSDIGADVVPGGRLSAMMLDTKSTFDLLVTRNASSPEQARRILENTFYRNVSGALGGTQEYMAMEKLHELHDEGDFDLIVVDTPPTRHALDFLDAPQRLTRLLDNRVFRLLMMPTRAYLRVASVAVQTFLRTVSRVVGSEVIEDVVAFFRAFEGMEDGFRERAAVVGEILTDPATAFVLVTSPRRDAMQEATFFADRLAEAGQSVQSLIVNRVHPSFGDETPAGLRAAADTLRHAGSEPATRLAALYDSLADFREIATLEREHLEALRARIGGDTVLAYIPYLAHDVHDFATLHEVGELLFDTISAR